MYARHIYAYMVCVCVKKILLCAFVLALFRSISIRKYDTQRELERSQNAAAAEEEELEVKGNRNKTVTQNFILFALELILFCFVCLSLAVCVLALVFAVVGTFVRDPLCNGCAYNMERSAKKGRKQQRASEQVNR